MKKFILISETITGDESYHYTSVKSLYNILYTNTLFLSTTIFDRADVFGDKKFFLSLSRTKSIHLGYVKDYYNATDNQRLVFDSNKLNRKFSSIPVNYFRGNRQNKSEYEDRLISDIPYITNINEYIKRIEILTDTNTYARILDVQSSGNIYGYNDKIYKSIYDLAKKRGIEINFYVTHKDMFMQTNNINNVINDIELDNYEPFKSHSLYDKDGPIAFLTLLLFDKSLLDENYKINPDKWDELKIKIDDFIRKANLSQNINKENVLSKIDKLVQNLDDLFEFRKIIDDLTKNLSFYYRSTPITPLMKSFYLLTNQMKKYKSDNILDLIYKKLDIYNIPKLKNTNNIEIYKIIKPKDDNNVKLPDVLKVDSQIKIKNMNFTYDSYIYLKSYINENNPTILELIKYFALNKVGGATNDDIEKMLNNISNEENVTYKVKE